uniref:Uncharacterized protein n=1 Tax=Lotus japonicus TaxID=34305 RepID=I3SQR2_LOTJA|nr:unknown [Lotus japonicus]
MFSHITDQLLTTGFFVFITCFFITPSPLSTMYPPPQLLLLMKFKRSSSWVQHSATLWSILSF